MSELVADNEQSSSRRESLICVAKAFKVTSEKGFPVFSVHSSSALAITIASLRFWNVFGCLAMIRLLMLLCRPLTINCTLYNSGRLCPRAIFSALAR